MIGEAFCSYERSYLELLNFNDELEMFYLSNIDTMNEWLFDKKLSAMIARLHDLEDDYFFYEKDYRDAISYESESYSYGDDNAAAEGETLAAFDAASVVEGICPETFSGRIITIEDIRQADRKARYEQYGEESGDWGESLAA